MTLKKKDLIKALRPGFEAQGYHCFNGSISGTSGFFGKKVSEDLNFLAALNIHRFYDDAFTVDLSLKPSTAIYSQGEDIPRECLNRPSGLLSKEERMHYFQKNDHDYWWSLYDNEDIRPSFFEILSIVEPRMVSNSELHERMRESIRLKSLVMIEKWVMDLYDQKQFEENLQFTPGKPIDGIPLDWFRAAESLLLTLFEGPNKYWVNKLASRAFTRSILDSLYSGNKGFL